MILEIEQRNSWSPRLTVFACIFALALVTRNAVPSGRQRAEVIFSLAEPTISLHEPVKLEFSARNESDRPVGLYLGHNFTANFRFVVTDPHGRRVATKPIGEEGFGALGKITVAPGKTYTLPLILNQWYPFGDVGRYQIDAELVSTPPRFQKGTTTVWRSPHLYLKILPRDPRRLTQLCATLTAWVLQSSDYVASGYAASELSYVQDPVAVPYLARVLSANRGGTFAAVQGLERIGTPQSVQVLKSNLATPDKLLYSQIQLALYEIRTGRHPGIAD